MVRFLSGKWGAEGYVEGQLCEMALDRDADEDTACDGERKEEDDHGWTLTP
jgi:hypothetical protein